MFYKRIELSWSLVYVGILNDLFSVQDVLDEMGLSLVSNLDSETISNLYLNADESQEEFLKYLEESKLSKKSDYKECKKLWSIVCLNNVMDSDTEIPVKLREIESIWAKFDYPSDWKPYILYA